MTTQKLTWGSKNEWGAHSRTHRARTSDWKFSALRPTDSGPWVISGWKNGTLALYKHVRTLAEAKRVAEDKLAAEATP